MLSGRLSVALGCLSLLFVLGAWVASHPAGGQDLPEIFPEMTCNTLEGKEVCIPKHTKGKYSLIGLAYSSKAEEQLKTWFKPVYYKFVYQPEKPVLFHEPYDVNLYFVPMFTGVQQLRTGSTVDKIKEQMDSKLHPYILIYKGDLKSYKNKLDFERRDVPYFFVLDEEGKIVYATSGEYSGEKMGKIEEVIDDF